MDNGTYYMAMEIPKDFTAAATSVRDENPHQAKINVTLNETNGFIPTMLGHVASGQVAEAVSSTVGAEVVEQLFVGFNTVGEGMDKAADGASQLDAGAKKAEDGAGQLGAGAGKLDNGMQEFNSKLQGLPPAARQLDDGMGQLYDGA